MPLLYDQFGRPIEAAKKPEKRPFAAAPLTDAFREYVADGLTPARLAMIFKEADAGDLRRQAELFDTIEEKDSHILGESGKRRNVILDVDLELTPASENPRDVKVAEEAKAFLEGIEDFEDTILCLQDAVGKGYAGVELVWDASEGRAIVEDFRVIEPGRFTFIDGSGILSRVPRLRTDDNAMGMDIPAWKVMFHHYGGKSGHPSRSGIHRVCAWMFLFKNYAIKDWVVFCEVFGMPLRLGKYTPGASPEDKAALEIAVRTLGSDAAGIISEATSIQFIEGKGTASTDLYENLATFCNKEISKALLGQTLSADVGDKGSYAAAKAHNDVRLDLLRADGRAIAATVRSQILRPWVGFNYGWDTPVPKYKAEFKEPEELNSLSRLIDRLADRMDIPASWVRDKFGIPIPEKGEECLQKRQNSPQIARRTLRGSTAMKEGMGLRSENFGLPWADSGRGGSSGPDRGGFVIAKKGPDRDEPDFVSLVAGRLESESDPMIQAMLAPVQQLMETSGSLAEFRERLVQVFGDMDEGPLGGLIQEAMAAADLGGRFEVDEENGLRPDPRGGADA